MSDPAAIAALYAQVVAEFPALDTLINNAGIMRNLNLNDDRDLSDVTREIEINLNGPIRMVQQFLPHLKTRPGALIVNVSSGLAFVPMLAAPVYSATKAAMHSYSQSLRGQLEGTGVTVVELAPRASRRRCFAPSSRPRPRGKRQCPSRCSQDKPSPGSKRASWKSGPAKATCSSS